MSIERIDSEGMFQYLIENVLKLNIEDVDKLPERDKSCAYLGPDGYWIWIWWDKEFVLFNPWIYKPHSYYLFEKFVMHNPGVDIQEALFKLEPDLIEFEEMLAYATPPIICFAILMTQKYQDKNE